ncbi:MAG: hypothetical protein AAF724_21995 [Pseudomonadota bacterium]
MPDAAAVCRMTGCMKGHAQYLPRAIRTKLLFFNDDSLAGDTQN